MDRFSKWPQDFSEEKYMVNEPQWVDGKTSVGNPARTAAPGNPGGREQSGINRLAELVESDLCASLAKPTKLLDIGAVGEFLALAGNGFDVTRIVSSRTQPDLCANPDENSRISLKIGEMAQLPFADAQFDTVLGLKALIQSSNLKSILSEWKRVTKPGGRIVFDLLSKDHICAAQNIRQENSDIKLNNVDFNHLNGALSTEDIIELADDLGLTLAKVIPYGVFTSEYPNFWLHHKLETKQCWRRFLSLLQCDELLLEFAAFLEKDVIGILPPLVAPKIMVAFDNVAPSRQNQKWLMQQSAFIAQAKYRLDFELLKTSFSSVDEKWQSTLNGLLKPLRNRVFFYNVFREIRGLLPFLNIESFLDTRYQAQFNLWHKQDELNSTVMALAKNWYRNEEIEKNSANLNVIVGQTFEYMLAQQLFSFFLKETK